MAHEKNEWVSAFDIASRVFKALANAVTDAGGNGADLRRIESDGELRQKVAALIVGASADLLYDKRMDGWKLLEHAPRRINSVDGLKLMPILKSGEDRVNGEEMVHRARVELDANLGQEDAEWLLEHEDLIPKEWRSYYIPFTATVWRDSDGYRSVASLFWLGGEWHLYWHWLDDGWDSRVSLLSVGKS